MREFLTGISIILIVVLTTVLVAPYFVDWNGQRDFLEARLSHALGQKVTIGGTIDLKLLPTPYLVLDQVVVGGDEASIRIGVHHLNLELAAAPLLHGEFDIVEARLEEPTIRMSLARDHTLPVLPAAPAFSADVRFDRIKVSDGTLAIADPESGRTFVLDHLDFDADAGSLTGPFKLTGAEGPAESRTQFRLATTAAENGRARAHLVLDETAGHPGLDLDGTVDLQAADGGLRQSFDGRIALAGHLPRRDRDPVAWKISGPFQADPKQAALAGGELRLGTDEAGLTLQADARAAFGDAPKLALDVKAKQLDIDRLAGAPTDGPKSPPQLPDLAELRGMVAATTPSIPTDLGLSVETATYGGETLSGIEAHVALGDAAAHAVKLAIDGPGGAHLAADGTLSTAVKPTFSGNLDLSAENLPRTLDWLRSVDASFPWAGRDLRFETVKVAGPVDLSAQAIASKSLSLTLDRSKLNGKASLVFGGRDRPKLTADLKAEALDLDSLPPVDSLGGGSSRADLDLRLDAKAVKVSRVGDGVLDTGRIRLTLATADRTIDLRDLRIDDLGGASIQAAGKLDTDGGRFAVTVDAGKLEAAAGLVRQLAPGAAADALVARASALSPAKLQIDASLTRGRNGALSPSQLAIVGKLGATSVDAAAKPETDRTDVTTVSATLQAPDGATLLRQLGLNTVPIEAIGASRVALTAHGTRGEPFETKLATNFGATKLDVEGRFDLLSAMPDGSGSLTLRSPDLTPLLQTLAIAFPDMTGRLPAETTGRVALDKGEVTLGDLKGRLAEVETRGTLHWRRAAAASAPSLTGTLNVDRLSVSSLVGLGLGREQPTTGGATWSRQPFAVGLVDPPRTAIALEINALDIVPGFTAKGAKLDIGVSQNVVSIEKLTGDLAGGRVEGGARLRRDGRQATLEGRLALDHVRIRLPDTLDADLNAKLDFGGSGGSSLALVSSLAGSGEAVATGLEVAGADPKALVKIFDDVEADVLAVDQDQVARAYQEVAKGTLAAGKARFSLRLVAGVLHFDPKTQETPPDAPVKSTIDASLDLPRARFETHVEEALRALPKNWTGAPPTIVVMLQGALGKPKRFVDVSNFLNAVAARALARESARIEAYEIDVRERAFFNARLQWEKRREEERQKADADAKRAEAERKARAEAARQERARKDQAAKAARDEADKAARDRPQDAPTKDRDAPEAQAPRQPAEQPPPSGATDPSSLGRY